MGVLRGWSLMAGPPLDYVDVATRLAEAYQRFPDLRITEHQPRIIQVDGGHLFVEVAVTIYRDPEDQRPCSAAAWEPLPGKTPFTRDSEMMNASTSAVGRCLGLMGFGARKSISSADEIATAKARQPAPPVVRESPGTQQQRYRDDTFQAQERAYQAERAAKASADNPPTDKQLRFVNALLKGSGRNRDDFDLTTAAGVSAAIEELKANPTAEEPF